MTAGGGTSVLVLDSPFGTAGTEPCIAEYTDGSTDLLSVLYRERVADRIGRIERHDGAVDSAAIISVGPTAEAGVPYGEYDAVRVLSDPADLTGMGMAITEWLGRLDEPASASVCFDSLSTMLQYAERTRALKFLHAITRQFGRAGGTVHCHLDPRAHDDRTIAQLREVFDEQRRADGVRGERERASSLKTDGGC